MLKGFHLSLVKFILTLMIKQSHISLSLGQQLKNLWSKAQRHIMQQTAVEKDVRKVFDSGYGGATSFILVTYCVNRSIRLPEQAYCVSIKKVILQASKSNYFCCCSTTFRASGPYLVEYIRCLRKNLFWAVLQRGNKKDGGGKGRKILCLLDMKTSTRWQVSYYEAKLWEIQWTLQRTEIDVRPVLYARQNEGEDCS